MNIRRMLLVGMLVALGACAALGALAMLADTRETLWRIIWTGIITAVIAAALLPLTLLTDRPRLRVGGLTGMGVLLWCWLCALALVWLDGSNRGEEFALTLLFSQFMGLPAAGVLLLISLKWARTAVIAFTAVAGASFILCEVGLWLVASGFWRLKESLMSSGMIAYGIGTLCAILLVNVGCGDRRYFRWAGILCGAAAAAIFIHQVWIDEPHRNEILTLAATLCLIACIVMAHANLVLMARVRASQRWLEWATIAVALASGLAAGLFSIYRVMEHVELELLTRGSATAAIVAACGSLALIVLSMLNRRTPEIVAHESPGALTATCATLICPRCQTCQQVPFGDSVCRQCELHINLTVIEPRCPVCGYLLYRLSSPKCPECGAPIRTSPSAATVPNPLPSPGGP